MGNCGKVLNYTGSWIRWPYLLMLGFLGVVSIYLGRAGKFVRRMNMESLLRNNAESFPCLHPVVGRGKYLLSKESFDAGPWRIARTPVQFALEHGLLLDMTGDPVSPENALRDGLPHTDLEAWGHCRFAEVEALEVIKEQLGKNMMAWEVSLHAALSWQAHCWPMPLATKKAAWPFWMRFRNHIPN